MSNKKLPKFLICNNQMVNTDLYILHTQKPRFLAKVIPTNQLELLDLQKQISVKVGELNYFIGCQTRYNNQLYYIGVVEFYYDDKIELPEIDVNAIGSGGLMSRMGDWFYSYLKCIENDSK